jgi:hypothetical protein
VLVDDSVSAGPAAHTLLAPMQSESALMYTDPAGASHGDSHNNEESETEAAVAATPKASTVAPPLQAPAPVVAQAGAAKVAGAAAK